MTLSEADGLSLLRLARRALESHFGLATDSSVDVVVDASDNGGVFATLKLDGELRGCIGYVGHQAELARAVARAVLAAATEDPRFPRLEPEEVTRIRISISVLSRADRVEALSEIELGRDGLMIEREGARGLLLPQVASERQWDRERFVSETCMKAGLAAESWKDPATVILRFTAWGVDEHAASKNAKS
jgi:AmmeMemoRadiSam system protein A